MAKLTITPNKKPKLFQRNVVYLMPESRPRIYLRRTSYIFNVIFIFLFIFFTYRAEYFMKIAEYIKNFIN